MWYDDMYSHYVWERSSHICYLWALGYPRSSSYNKPCALAVLKKNSSVRIPSIFPKAQPIVLKPETLTDYRSFSVFVKTACRALDPGQNVIYFTDVDNQQQFLYDIPCLFAAAHEKTEIDAYVFKHVLSALKLPTTSKKISSAIQHQSQQLIRPLLSCQRNFFQMFMLCLARSATIQCYNKNKLLNIFIFCIFQLLNRFIWIGSYE